MADSKFRVFATCRIGEAIELLRQRGYEVEVYAGPEAPPKKLILEKVAEAEAIEIKEEEVDELIRELAQERHEAPAALKTRLTRDGELPTIERRLRNQKALDLIYHNAKIKRKSEGVPNQAEG